MQPNCGILMIDGRIIVTNLYANSKTDADIRININIYMSTKNDIEEPSK
jgi:hypothetical protein